jgi:hypothetical protein
LRKEVEGWMIISFPDSFRGINCKKGYAFVTLFFIPKKFISVGKRTFRIDSVANKPELKPIHMYIRNDVP